MDAVKFEVTTLKEAIVELQHQLATHRDNAKQSLTDHEKTTKSEVLRLRSLMFSLDLISCDRSFVCISVSENN